MSSAENLVSDHSATAYRPLWYVRTDGSANIIQADWLNRGNEMTMWFKARQTLASGLTQTSYTAQATTGWIPTGLNDVEALFGGIIATGE